MKNILRILIVFWASFSLHAQSPVLSLEDRNPYDTQAGAYYKDLENAMDPYEGTWVYNEGNTTLKIVLIKKKKYYSNKKKYYIDLMIGEYQYIENGIEKINTLSRLNENLGYSHGISGNTIFRNCNFLPEGDCTEGEVRLRLGLIDAAPDKAHWATMVLKQRIINGKPAIKVFMSFNYTGRDYPGVTTPSPTLPWQKEYVMYKQLSMIRN